MGKHRSIPSNLKPTAPSLALLASATPVSQGAEAKVYKGYLQLTPSYTGLTSDSTDPEQQLVDLTESSPSLTPPSEARPEPVLLKHRFAKGYRHPTLDALLTKSRVTGESRALLKCLRSGVSVPEVKLVDVREGVLGIEWIEGSSVRALLGGGADDEDEGEETEVEVETETEEAAAEDALNKYGVTRDSLMEMVGVEIAKMHKADVIHGDLTTSNMMLRHPSSPKGLQLVLIDFGLAFTSAFPEDKAVDLYVLERAFASTHPASESMFGAVLNAYGKATGEGWEKVRKKLDEVRLRGRKRSMVG